VNLLAARQFSEDELLPVSNGVMVCTRFQTRLRKESGGATAHQSSKSSAYGGMEEGRCLVDIEEEMQGF
jgi:hypothetical protein